MKTQTLEEMWQEFAAAVSVPVGGIQWSESRRCFYAGCMAMLFAVKRMDGPDEDCVRALVRWDDESKQFMQRMRDGKV